MAGKKLNILANEMSWTIYFVHTNFEVGQKQVD